VEVSERDRGLDACGLSDCVEVIKAHGDLGERTGQSSRDLLT
jgi:hypothetical protein